MLGALGSAAALGLSCAVLKLALDKMDVPKWVTAKPDWRVLLFTVGMTLAATLFFGLLPALQIARQRQQKTLARQILVAAQIAASSILLIVAALLVRATQHALYTDPGFEYEHMVSIDPGLGHHGYHPTSAQNYLKEMQNRLATVPSVKAVSLVKLPPMGHIVANSTVEVRGRKVTVYPNWVSPNFFATMGMPLRLGRTFNPGEKGVVVVSESFAHLQWPGENPLGKALGDGTDKSTVIGVVGDAHMNALSDDDAVEQYWAAQPEDMPDMVLIVRSAGEPGSISALAKSIAANLDKSVFPEIRQLKILYSDNVAQIENIAVIVSLVGLAAVAIAAIGLVGLVAFVMTQRTKEIAIRMALGARRTAVLSAVLRQFQWPLAVGLIAGTVFAAFGSKILRVALYGVNNLDPASYAAGLALLVLITAMSMLLPVARILRLNIAFILHHD